MSSQQQQHQTIHLSGGSPVPVYSTQDPVPMSAPPLRHRTHNVHPVEHFQYASRNHPPPLQIPSSSVNTPQFGSPTTHQLSNSLPSIQPHPPPSLRPYPDGPMSPLDRTSLPQPSRRQSEPSLPISVHAEKQPAFDPVIMSATDAALAPVRGALDTVWTLALTNMRLAMNKMNNDFTYLATQERQKNAHLTTKVASLESQLQAARQESKMLKKERQELQNIIQAHRDDNRKLHSEKELWEIERRGLTGSEGRRGDSELPQIDMNKVMGAVTEQVSKQMDQKMSVIMDQIEEQRFLRSQAEQRFAETLHHLSHIQNRESSESSPTVQQSSSSPYIHNPPSLQRGSHSPTSTRVVSPILSEAKLPTGLSGAKQDIMDDDVPPISPTNRRSSTVLKNSPHISTPMARLVDPSQNLLTRTSSSGPQPRKKPRLMDEREEGHQTASEDIRSDPERQRENAPLAMQQQDGGDVSRQDVFGSPMVKPEPTEDVEIRMDIQGSKGSKETAPSSPTEPTGVRHSIGNPHPNIPTAPSFNQRHTKLGIGHIDLLYRTDNGTMTCRMCLSRSRDVLVSRDRSNKVPSVKKFEQGTATWDELISHCRSDHPKTCRDIERLGPTQIAEMKQRLVSGEKSSRG